MVTIPQFLPIMSRPQIGDYDNPYIIRTTPCEKKKGKCYDLRTGEEIKKTEDMLEWKNLTGTFFRYPDGYELLLSRRYSDNKILVFEPNGRSFNPESMTLRSVIHREEKQSH